MHDRNGTEIKVGDTVLVPVVVEELGPSPDYCNVKVRLRNVVGSEGMTYTWFNTGHVVLFDR